MRRVRVHQRYFSTARRLSRQKLELFADNTDNGELRGPETSAQHEPCVSWRQLEQHFGKPVYHEVKYEETTLLLIRDFLRIKTKQDSIVALFRGSDAKELAKKLQVNENKVQSVKHSILQQLNVSQVSSKHMKSLTLPNSVVQAAGFELEDCTVLQQFSNPHIMEKLDQCFKTYSRGLLKASTAQEPGVDYEAQIAEKSALLQNLANVLSQKSSFVVPSEVFGYLLNQFNTYKLLDLSELVFYYCISGRYALNETVFKELIEYCAVASAELKFELLASILLGQYYPNVTKKGMDAEAVKPKPNHLLDDKKLRVNYQLAFEDVVNSKRQSDGSGLYGEFNIMSRSLLVPERIGASFDESLKFTYSGYKNLLEKFFSHHMSRISSCKVLVPTDDANTENRQDRDKLQVVDSVFHHSASINTLYVALEASIKLNRPEFFDKLVNMMILNTHITFSRGKVMESRVNLEPHTKYQKDGAHLLANNLIFDSIIDESASTICEVTDVDFLVSPKLLYLYVARIAKNSDKAHRNEQVKHLVQIIENFFLRKLVVTEIESLYRFMKSNRKAFDLKYNNFFNIENIIKHEVYQKLQKKGLIPVLSKLFNVCVLTNDFTALDRLETVFFIDFSNFVEDSLLNEAIAKKEKYLYNVRNENFQKENKAWKESKPKGWGILGLFKE